MEVVGAASSVAALAELAIKSYRSAFELVKAIQNAPKEFVRVVQQLDMLQCELSFLSEIEKQAEQSDELPLLSTEAALLERALFAANELISGVRDQLDKYRHQKPGAKARLQWALKDKSHAEELLSSLKHIEISLTNVLLLVNIRLSSYSWKMAVSLQSLPKLNAPGQTGASSRPNKGGDAEFRLAPRTLTSLFDRNPQAWNKFYGSWRSPENPLLAWLGLQIILTRYGNSLHTTYYLSGSFGLWEWLGARAVYFSFGLRIFPLSSLGFSILGGGLSIKTIVPETSELMTACQRGDVLAVRALFASQRASPYDITPSNRSSLCFAIESGSLELVRFLCHHGADANTTFGKFETSPLEWAFKNRQIEIARFLLGQGARLDYISFRGWTPVMLLFNDSYPAVPPEFFQLLSGNSFTDFDVQDGFGATALHRAALWGTAGDVHALLQLGASLCLTDREVGWTPAFEAASANNVVTLKRLAESGPVGFIHDVDFNGRTILHVAIEAGGLETMRLVLDLGADPHRTVGVESDHSNAIAELTPIEFARSKGKETYQGFIQALRLAGYDIYITEDLGEESVFWDAADSLI